MYWYSIYLGLKGAPKSLLWGLCMYYIATWTLWVARFLQYASFDWEATHKWTWFSDSRLVPRFPVDMHVVLDTNDNPKSRTESLISCSNQGLPKRVKIGNKTYKTDI